MNHQPIAAVLIAALALLPLSGCATATSGTEATETASTGPTEASAPVTTSADPATMSADAQAQRDLLVRQADRNGPVVIDFVEEDRAPSARENSQIAGVRLSEALAQSNFDPLPATAEVYTGFVTTPGMGRNLETDSAEPARIRPDFDHDLAWVIRYHHVPTAALGKIDATPTAGGPQQYTDMVVFVKPSGFWVGWEIPEEPQ